MSVKQTHLSSNALHAYMKDRPDKVYKAISPSSLGGCMRSHYWKLKGVKETTPPSTAALVNFEVGHHWEAVLAKAYEKQGILVKWYEDGVDEPYYDKETGLGGTPDILIRDNDELVIVDSKTVNSMWFNYMKKMPFDKWVKDNDHYITQQIAYIILARAKKLDVKRAILSFASKNDGYIGLEIEITPTDDDILRVKERARKLKHFVDTNTLPPCECTDWRQGYCGYGHLSTQAPNSKKKMVNTECCPDTNDKLEEWRDA